MFTYAIPSSRTAFDPPLQAFLISWDWQTIRSGIAAVFQAPIFYPEPNTLAYMDHMLGESLFAAPAWILFGSPAAAYNFLFIGSFVASAWAVYRLTRFLGVSRPGSLLAGFLFAFGPYRFANLDLLNQLQTQFLPLGLLFGIRFIERYRLRDFLGLAGTALVQVYFGWYYTAYLAIALVILVAVALARGRLEPARIPNVKAGAVALLAVLLAVPVVLPYVREHAALPEFRRTLGESALYSADILDYVKWNQNSVAANWTPVPTGGQSYWPGIVTVALSLLGAWKGARGPRESFRVYWVALAVTAFVFSLGPILHVAGARIWLPLPYAVLYYLFPGLAGMRAPARFASLVLLALAVLASLGYDRLRLSRARDRVGRHLLEGGLALLAVVTALPQPLTNLTLPSPDRLEPVYAWLAREPGGEPVLELPVPATDAEEDETHALRQLHVLFDGKPRLDGTSGFVSRRYRAFRTTMQAFPSSSAVRAASEMGARIVVVHFGEYAPERRDSLRAAIRAEPHLVLAISLGKDAAFRLR